MTLLATIVLLGVLIFVHELGHFGAAKAVGIGVERFSIGFGPRIWGFQRGQTEYVLCAIPLGGYVRMQGMDDELAQKLEGGTNADGGGADELPPPEPGPGDFDGKPIWARTFVISAGVLMNMLFALVVFSATVWIWGTPELAVTRVASVDDGRLPPGAEALAVLEPGSKITQVGDASPETWEQIGRAIAEAPPGTLRLVADDPSAVFEIDLSEDQAERAALFRALAPWFDPVVSRVESGGPAEGGGLRAGDRITSVAGVPVPTWTDLVREVGDRPGERVQLGVRRGDEDLTRVVRVGEVRGAERGERVGRLGIYRAPDETLTVPVPAGEAAARGFGQTVTWTAAIVQFLGNLFTGDVSLRSVGSIGTIAAESGRAAREGPRDYLYFMAFFSVNLAILNLLPIPVLDGGHLVFLAIEAIRGRRLSVKQRLRWSQVGLVVLLLIMVLALGNDLLRWLGF